MTINLNEWINNFVEAWLTGDINAIKALFSECEAYYESPFCEAVTGEKEIEGLWLDIVHQKDINLVVDTIAQDDKKAALHWYLKYRDDRDDNVYEMDGTYEIAFNENGKCCYFKQWWVMKE